MTEGRAGGKAATDRLALLSDVLRSFADATTDYPRLLETIAKRTALLLGHHCSIRLLSDDARMLETVATFDPLGKEAGTSLAALAVPYPVGETLVLQEALATGKGVLLMETVTDPVAKPFETRELTTSFGITGVIIAPLHARGQTYGAFFVVARGSSPTLTRDDLELAEALAHHAALAISNGRLFQALRREVDERQRAETSLAAVELARQYERSIVDTIPHPLVALGPDRCVRSANRTFFELFRSVEEDVIGKPLVQIASGALDVAPMHELLAGVFPVRSGALVTDVQILIETPALGRRTMLVNARKMYRRGTGRTRCCSRSKT